MGKEKQWELEKDYDKREFFLSRIEGKTGYQFNNFQNVPDKDLEQLYIWICNDGNPDYNDQYIESFEYRGMKKQSQDEGPIDMISNDELDTAMDEGGEGLDDLGGGDLGGDIGGGMPGDMEGGPGGMEGPQAPMPVDDVDWDSMNIVWDEENDLDAKRRRGDDGLEIDYSRII